MLLEKEQGILNKKQLTRFHEVYDLWLSTYEKTVEESTFVKTVGIFNNHILPTLGEYLVDKVTVDICQGAVNTWSRKLKNFNMVTSYASRIFDFCLKRDMIHKNPFNLVEMPKVKRKVLLEQDIEENFYTRDELNEFLSCLEQESNFKEYALFRLLAYSGMRKGEALALRWKDIFFSVNAIQVNKAISRGKNNKLYLKGTKTNDNRKLDMDPMTMQILKNGN